MSAETPRRTKIVATLGPASSSPETLFAMAAAGMDAARLNFSHGSHEEHAARAQVVRSVQEEVGRPVALIADLQGPKLRVGELSAPVTLERVEMGRVRCTVLAGGLVASHKGVNVPGVPVPIPALTRKDMDDLEFALELGVDFIALSFVRSPADVRDLHDLIEAAGSNAHVIAKIEKSEAVDSLDAILAETDAVMVARGDLGVEIGAALVPLVQKRIIMAARERAKPVMTATY